VTTLHITNGDCAGDTLRLIVGDRVLTVADVLHEGPCPPVNGDAWHEVRARFLAAGVGTSKGYEQIKASLAATDEAIAAASTRGDEIVLWFEHDLFDQLALIRTIFLIGRAVSYPAGGSACPAPRAGDERHPPNVRAPLLICIDRFPGVVPFYGLGQLTRDQMATLIGTGVPVTPDLFALAAEAWAAFRSPDPQPLLTIPESRDLPFLRPALRRFLAEYPSSQHGLSRTEELALQALRPGDATAGTLFHLTQTRQAAPFMGDSTFFEILQRLAACRVPLVTVEASSDGVGVSYQTNIAITSAGRDVLAGRADQVRLNGVDIWRGGVHLAGSDRSAWRWDARSETLVS
jgi:hypothetical protein